MLPGMSDERTEVQTGAAQSGAVQGQPEASAPQPAGELLVSGVDTGPKDDERQNLTPTEERARLSHQEDGRDPNRPVNPENDPAALADRGD